MPTSGLPRQDRRGALFASPLFRAVALLVLLFASAAGLVSWLSAPAGPAATAAAASPGGLEHAAAHIKLLPGVPGGGRSEGIALAGHATQEGHWRFVNRAGETFTAGTPEEMRRAASVLHPDVKPGVRVSLYVPEGTIFGDRTALKTLPSTFDLFVVSGSEGYRVLKASDSAAERVFAEVRPNLVVELSEARLFREAAWQLARPLDKASVRVLALEPGGPTLLSTSPRLDAATGRALIDAIDPDRLPGAMGAVRGQTLLVTGRVAGDLLYFQPSSGRERSLQLNELFRAAEAADVNLIVLHAPSTPRQPGGRNWLWLKVNVDGLDEALQRAGLADFLNALGGPSRRLAAAAMPGGTRTLLTLRPATELPGSGTLVPMADFFSGIVADVSGKVVTTALQANLRSAERQQELDRRLIPGVPSMLQLAYLGLMGLGALGVPLSRVWWSRAWPPEAASDYAGRIGYWLASAVRHAAYVLIFIPLTALVAAPWNIARQIADAGRAPLRVLGRLRRRPGATDVKKDPADAQEQQSDGTARPGTRQWSELGDQVPQR